MRRILYFVIKDYCGQYWTPRYQANKQWRGIRFATRTSARKVIRHLRREWPKNPSKVVAVWRDDEMAEPKSVLKSLPQEEYDRLEPLSQTRIAESLAKGREAARAAIEQTPRPRGRYR